MIIPKRVIVVECEIIYLNVLTPNLDKLAFRECLKEAEESWGFFPVDELLGEGPLIITVDRYSILNLRHDRKKLNKTKLSRAWTAEVKKKEKESGMVFDKIKRDELREQVKRRLFKDKEPDESYMKAVYDSISQRFYVLTSEPGACEFLIEKLNKALANQNVKLSFKADTLQPELTDTLTKWVFNPDEAKENGFEVGDDMHLKGEQSSSATLKHQEANSSVVREHLLGKKDVHKIKLISQDSQGIDMSMILASTRIMSQIDLKAVCNPKIKGERDTHSDSKSMKEAELLIWMGALEELWTKVKTIPM